MALLHGFFELLAIFDNSGFYHLAEKVVSFTCTLPDSGEDRKSVMFFCNIVYQLLDEDGLAHSGATEQTDLAALKIRLKKINDLDAGEKHLLGRSEVLKFWRFPVDRKRLLLEEIAKSVDPTAGNGHHPAALLRSGRHLDGRTGIYYFQASLQAIGGVHRDAPDSIFSDMLLNLDDKFPAVFMPYFQRLMDVRKILGLRI